MGYPSLISIDELRANSGRDVANSEAYSNFGLKSLHDQLTCCIYSQLLLVLLD
ncbi:hypothetical protein [Synechococcus sp. M16CYN]|uniref:hypothetical protein n=1 Tax=Synechococcus sp. M16CYN TaxID=3103139 RepID=UPI003342A434